MSIFSYIHIIYHLRKIARRIDKQAVGKEGIKSYPFSSACCLLVRTVLLIQFICDPVDNPVDCNLRSGRFAAVSHQLQLMLRLIAMG